MTTLILRKHHHTESPIKSRERLVKSPPMPSNIVKFSHFNLEQRNDIAVWRNMALRDSTVCKSKASEALRQRRDAASIRRAEKLARRRGTAPITLTTPTHLVPV
jgi:hypothetical protein